MLEKCKSKLYILFCLARVVVLFSTILFQFPYCDGAHNKHNKETGDNVGPVNIKGKPAAE